MKFTKLKLIASGTCFVVVVGVIVIAQQKPTQIASDQNKVETGDLKNSTSRKSDKSDKSVGDTDKGFEIVALRRITLISRSTYTGQEKRKDLIEIELYCELQLGMKSLPEFIQIGTSSFVPSRIPGLPCDSKKNCVQVIMTPQEFEELKDGSLVVLRSGFPMDSEKLKELYEDGEPTEIAGPRFGRLDKMMIYEYPPMEINSP